MLFLDLTDDSLAQILKAVVHRLPIGEGARRGLDLLQAVRCTCTRLRNLVESSHVEPFWEAMSNTFFTFKQQPRKTVELRPWTYADPWPPSVTDGPCTDCGLAPVGNERLPWKDTFASAHSVLGRPPLEWLRQTGATLPDDDLRTSILSARMLLHRAVSLELARPYVAGGPDSPEKLILSVLGYCLVKLNRGKPYAPCDIYRREREQLLRLLSGLVSEATWPELSKARCRYYPNTLVAKTFAATDEAQRMREILDMGWGGPVGPHDAIVELPGLMYGGYDVSLDDEILEMACPATTPIGEEMDGELWSSTFHRVDQLMTPDYGVELLPMHVDTAGAINQSMMVGEPSVYGYLAMAISENSVPLLERFLRHIPPEEDVEEAVAMAIHTNRFDHLKALVDSVHCDLHIVNTNFGEHGDPSLVFCAAEHGDEEMFHYLAARLDLPSYAEENANGVPFLMVVAMRFSVDTLRTLLPGIPSHALHRHAYLYEHAAEACKRNLFDALCWAGLTIPFDYIPLRADIETEPALRRLVLQNLGPDAAARYDGMKSDTAYYT